MLIIKFFLKYRQGFTVFDANDNLPDPADFFIDIRDTEKVKEFLIPKSKKHLIPKNGYAAAGALIIEYKGERFLDFSDWSVDDIFNPFLHALEELQMKNSVDCSITTWGYYIAGCEGYTWITLKKIWGQQLTIRVGHKHAFNISEKEFVRILTDEAYVAYSALMRNQNDFNRIEKLRAIYKL